MTLLVGIRTDDRCIHSDSLEGALQLEVCAHAIDFGTNGCANLVELAELQVRVAGDLGVAVGALTMNIKSAHLYETELAMIRRIVAAAVSDQ